MSSELYLDSFFTRMDSCVEEIKRVAAAFDHAWNHHKISESGDYSVNFLIDKYCYDRDTTDDSLDDEFHLSVEFSHTRTNLMFILNIDENGIYTNHYYDDSYGFGVYPSYGFMDSYDSVTVDSNKTLYTILYKFFDELMAENDDLPDYDEDYEN